MATSSLTQSLDVDVGVGVASFEAVELPAGDSETEGGADAHELSAKQTIAARIMRFKVVRSLIRDNATDHVTQLPRLSCRRLRC